MNCSNGKHDGIEKTWRIGNICLHLPRRGHCDRYERGFLHPCFEAWTCSYVYLRAMSHIVHLQSPFQVVFAK